MRIMICAECGSELLAFYDTAQHLPYLICKAHPEAGICKPNRKEKNSHVFYLKSDDRDLLKRLRLTMVCAECGSELYALYSRDQHLPYLVCSKVYDHEGICKPNKKEKNNYEGGLKQMAQVEQEHGLDKARQLAKYQGVTSLTRPQAMEIMETIWPLAPVADKVAAAILCSSYGLNPLAGHVFLIPFKGKETGETTWSRVWGIKAKRLVASRRGGYSYLDMTPRIMTEEEQVKVWGRVDKDNLSYLTRLKDMKTGAEVYGYGKWPSGKDPYGSDKGNSKANMASIRSESQALDRLRPAEMPSGFGVADEQYIEGEGRILDTVTGEIIAQPPDDETKGEPVASKDADLLRDEEKDKIVKQPSERSGINIDEILQQMLDKGMKTAGEQRMWIAKTFPGTTVSGPLAEVIGRLNPEQQQDLCKKLGELKG